MTKPKKIKPVRPVLAWTRTHNGEFVDRFQDGTPICYAKREFGKTTGHTWIRVEIRPAPKRQEIQSWWTRVLASVDAMQAMVDKYGTTERMIAVERAKLMTILVEQVPAPKCKGARK